MIQQLFTIARNTFTESVRQHIYIVLLLVVMIILVFIPTIAAYTMDDDNQFMLEMSLSTLFFGGVLLAAFTSTGALTEEVESRTVLTVVSKPVGRPVFVLGKFLGVAAAITPAFWIMSLVMLLTVRHRVMQTASQHFDQPVLTFGLLAVILAISIATLGNYFYHWTFTSTVTYALTAALTLAYLLVMVINKDWSFQSIAAEFSHDGSLHHGQLLIALLLVYQSVLILTAVAIACSTRLGQIMTLVVSTLVFFLGILNNSLFGRFADESVVAKFLFRITPNLQFLWPADALLQKNDFTTGYVLMVTVYCFLWVGAMLGLAVALFQTREVG